MQPNNFPSDEEIKEMSKELPENLVSSFMVLAKWEKEYAKVEGKQKSEFEKRIHGYIADMAKVCNAGDPMMREITNYPPLVTLWLVVVNMVMAESIMEGRRIEQAKQQIGSN